MEEPFSVRQNEYNMIAGENETGKINCCQTLETVESITFLFLHSFCYFPTLSFSSTHHIIELQMWFNLHLSNPVQTYLLTINVYTFFLFGWDKYQAVSGGWRVPERRLLVCSTIGGWGGALLGQLLFHHKTKKQPFVYLFNLIPVVWAVLLYAWWRR